VKRVIRWLDVLEDWMAIVGDERVWWGIGLAVPFVVLAIIS
jgi:hypothetical protein